MTMEFQNHFHQNKDWNREASSQCNKRNCNFRTTSIKTRIETNRYRSIQGAYSAISEPLPSKQGLKPPNPYRPWGFLLFQNHFHQNKDWNSDGTLTGSKLGGWFQNHFHQNKDWNCKDTICIIDYAGKFQNHFHQNKDWNAALLFGATVNATISEPLPSKQGLKPHLDVSGAGCSVYFRTTSIKTRIETKKHKRLSQKYLNISEPLPSKQGLKRHGNRDKILYFRIFQNHFHQNKDWNRIVPSGSPLTAVISEPLPSKQGLKQDTALEAHIIRGYFRTTSIKTRIETESLTPCLIMNEKISEPLPSKQGLKHFIIYPLLKNTVQFQNHFHQNKDWNKWRHVRVYLILVFQNHFHQNKDWNWKTDCRY